MIPATAYQWIYLLLILYLCITKSARISSYSQSRLLAGSCSEWKKACILSILLIIFIGTRPVDKIFADTVGYAQGYEAVRLGWLDTGFLEERGEPLWAFIHDSCAHMGWSVHAWFTLIEALYIGPVLISCHRIIKKNEYIALLFVVSAFSFFAYGVNTIRNGVACSLLLLSITYLENKRFHKLIAIILCLAAFYIHRSAILPASCLFVSYYFIKKPSWSIWFWLLAIILSLTIGNQIEAIFSNLGFADNRLSGYIQGQYDTNAMAGFSHVGFRWDFLLYSSMPIILGTYIIFKKKIFDSRFLLLFNTYVLSNAFWIMIIRASFSDRFAYLSWFLYPIVLAYPLLKFSIWRRQGANTAIILMLYIGFTLFINGVYYTFIN